MHLQEAERHRMTSNRKTDAIYTKGLNQKPWKDQSPIRHRLSPDRETRNREATYFIGTGRDDKAGQTLEWSRHAIGYGMVGQETTNHTHLNMRI